MIAKKEGASRVTRRLEVEVTAEEAEKLKASGFVVSKRRIALPKEETLTHMAIMCAAERDALTLARGVFGERVSVDRTRTKLHQAMVQKKTRIDLAMPADRLEALLSTKEWKGSRAIDTVDSKWGLVWTIVHPSGARCHLRREP